MQSNICWVRSGRGALLFLLALDVEKAEIKFLAEFRLEFGPRVPTNILW